jgi:uncharacterized protein YukE
VPQGYGVEPDQLAQAASRFAAEGDAVGTLADAVENPAGRLGLHFADATARYQQLFALVSASAKAMSSAAAGVSHRLGDVAGAYTHHDQESRHHVNRARGD